MYIIVRNCTNCGELNADYPLIARDICSTDMGAEIRESIEWLCAECAEISVSGKYPESPKG